MSVKTAQPSIFPPIHKQPQLFDGKERTTVQKWRKFKNYCFIKSDLQHLQYLPDKLQFEPCSLKRLFQMHEFGKELSHSGQIWLRFFLRYLSLN